MHRFNYLWACATLALLAACAHANGYGAPAQSQYGAGSAADNAATAAAGDYGLAPSSASANAGSQAANAAANADSGLLGPVNAPPSSYGSNQNIPYAPGNTRGNTLASSITYPQNKGEILIHRPAPIIVKRPPTKVLVNHPPLVVKPAPVVLHKPPAVVLRKVFIKHHPRPVKVEPVYVNVVKPPAEKYFVNEKQQQYAHQYALGAGSSGHGQGSSQSGAGSYASNADHAATNAGYQLVHGNQGLADLANIGSGPEYSAHSAPDSHGHGHSNPYGPAPSATQYAPASAY